MTMKFYGSIKDLKHILYRHDIHGSWRREPLGVHMMHCPSGANLHWAQGSKSLWIDGKTLAKRRLEAGVAAALHLLDDS